MLGCKKSLSRQTTCESPVSSVLSLMVSFPVGGRQPNSTLPVPSQSPREGACSALLSRARGDAGRGRGECSEPTQLQAVSAPQTGACQGGPGPASIQFLAVGCLRGVLHVLRLLLVHRWHVLPFPVSSLPQEVSYSAILVLSLRVECTALCNSVGLPLSGLFFF